MKRPLQWIFIFLFSMFLFMYYFYNDKIQKTQYILDPFVEDSCNATVTGVLDHIEKKKNSKYLYINDAVVKLNINKNSFHFSKLLVIQTKNLTTSYTSGNKLQIHGDIQKFQIPSNSGQFNEKEYYREQNIYYKCNAKNIKCISSDCNYIKATIYLFRDQLQSVYQKTLSSKDAGIISAMILGEKSLLDINIKELYQINGIGHILAISGLHISILCMIVYKILSLLRIPKPLPFLITSIVVTGYAIMTGFGISTNRAVLMMLLFLFAKEIGRSYDSISAMFLCAILILIQKPYALFSSGFLLSYFAIIGVVFVQPVIKGFLFGTISMQDKQNRKRKRFLTEQRKNCSVFPLLSIYIKLQSKVIAMFLCSVSIWITTIPILLYFYYEFPTYGILLNMMILPFVTIIVFLAILGGLIGLVCLPAARLILFIVHYILAMYENLCNCILHLPYPVQIWGQPKIYWILIFYILLFSICLYCKMILTYHETISRKKRITFLLIFSMMITCLHPGYRKNNLRITLLDVGQGDGIIIQTSHHKTILIDGGSSSVQQVGKYRILPFLKYYGIQKIDYLIMTHADDDHISGQKEILEKLHANGMQIMNYLLPEPTKKLQSKNYREIKNSVLSQKISLHYIHTDDILHIDNLSLYCLNPIKNFAGESANSYSTTLSLKYQDFSMILTGDLEASGEEGVLKKLAQNDFKFPKQYDILKVAHHGSKNSTSDAFLAQINPKISLISCGKNNRYGHPHQELIKRLEKNGSKILQTPKTGAITIESDGQKTLLQLYYKSK